MSSTSPRNRFPLAAAASLAVLIAAGCTTSAPTPEFAAGGTAQAQPPAVAAGDQAPPAASAGSPTAAFNRLRDAVIAQDWGAFYDGMGPKMREADAADPARAGLDESLSPREKFIKGMEATMAKAGSPGLDSIGADAFTAIWEGAEVKAEAVDGDRATLTITKAGSEWRELFVREGGTWKFDGVPEGNGP